MLLFFKTIILIIMLSRIILLSTGSNMIKILRSKCKMEQKGDRTNTRVIISKWILAFLSYSKNIHSKFARIVLFPSCT